MSSSSTLPQLCCLQGRKEICVLGLSPLPTLCQNHQCLGLKSYKINCICSVGLEILADQRY